MELGKYQKIDTEKWSMDNTNTQEEKYDEHTIFEHKENTIMLNFIKSKPNE